MKALQTRSPIHLYYNDINLDNVSVTLFVNKDITAFDVTDNPDYDLSISAINNEITLEIAELLRSKNDYLFENDFYDKRDTAIYALIQADLLDNAGDIIETKYNLIRIRDGYIERNEQVQLLNNQVSSNFNDWTLDNLHQTEDVSDCFGGTNAITIDNAPDGNRGYVQYNINTTDVITVSVIAKSSDSTIRITTVGGLVEFDLVSDVVVSQTAGLILPTDILDLGNGFKLVSAVFNGLDTYVRFLTDDVLDSSLTLFSPNVIKGNWLNSDASDLVLQSNYMHYTDGNIQASFMTDRKEANTTYFYPGSTIGVFFDKIPNAQAYQVLVDDNNNDLIYYQLDGTETRQTIGLNELCEPKYTPVKISFINKFGVIQDLVFFKKRVDTLRTTEDDYKANILQGGQSLNHVGQKQILNKNSMRSVKISSGFYPEDFNTVFEQLLNSLNYWIDDEPAVLKSSNWTEKTSVNDKLISYNFDFEFANEDINNIR